LSIIICIKSNIFLQINVSCDIRNLSLEGHSEKKRGLNLSLDDHDAIVNRGIELAIANEDG